MKGTSPAARLRLAAVAAEYVESLGRGVRFRREQLGLSRSDVARKLPGKTNENALYRWEGGKHKPSDDTLEALAAVLKVTHWTQFMDLDPERPDVKANGTPALFSVQEPAAGDTVLIERLEALEQRVTGQLAEHADRVEQMLRRQDELLERIEQGVQAEHRAKQAAEQQAQELRDLLVALGDATQALSGAARATEATPAPPAK